MIETLCTDPFFQCLRQTVIEARLQLASGQGIQRPNEMIQVQRIGWAWRYIIIEVFAAKASVQVMSEIIRHVPRSVSLIAAQSDRLAIGIMNGCIKGACRYQRTKLGDEFF